MFCMPSFAGDLPSFAPFQQMILVDSSAYASYEATDLKNVEFFYANGTIIQSWLESGKSQTSTSFSIRGRLGSGFCQIEFDRRFKARPRMALGFPQTVRRNSHLHACTDSL